MFYLVHGDPKRPVWTLHSALVATAFVLGVPQPRVEMAFCRRVFEALGYLNGGYERRRDAFLQAFAAYGLDLADAVSRWESTGAFMYSCVHPKVFALIDVMRALVRAHPELGTPDREAEAALADIPDELARVERWAIYPEIGEERGFETTYVWQRHESEGRESLDLKMFIARTYDKLRGVPEMRAELIPQFELYAAAIDNATRPRGLGRVPWRS
jgi:hypothetical protein